MRVDIGMIHKFMGGFTNDGIILLQVIDIPTNEDKIIKDWFKKIVKKNKHLMYDMTYKDGLRGVQKVITMHCHLQ